MGYGILYQWKTPTGTELHFSTWRKCRVLIGVAISTGELLPDNAPGTILLSVRH